MWEILGEQIKGVGILLCNLGRYRDWYVTSLTYKVKTWSAALGESSGFIDKSIGFPWARPGHSRRELDCSSWGKWPCLYRELTPEESLCGEDCWKPLWSGGLALQELQAEVSRARNYEPAAAPPRIKISIWTSATPSGSQSQMSTVPAVLGPVPFTPVSLPSRPNTRETSN